MNRQIRKMQIRATLIMLVVMLFSSPFIPNAKADVGDMGLDVNLFSYHAKRCYSNCSKKYNENNTGLTYSYRIHENGEIMLGFLKNSFDGNSRFAAFNLIQSEYQFKQIKLIPGFTVGAIDGYGDTPVKYTYGDYAPILMPNITFQKSSLRFNIGTLYSANTMVATLRAGFVF